MIKFKILFLVLALGGINARAQPGPQPEINPQDIQRGEFEALRDRLSTSLMFRGELADKIIDAGLTGDIVTFEGEVTYSAARLALLDWIKKNPDKAARMALNIKNGVKHSREPISYDISNWEINAGFLEKIKALSAAAKDGRVSAETLELAAKRLYEGSPGGVGGEAVAGGVQRSGGSDFFSVNNTDYKLNRAGLERELTGAGAVLDSMRGPAGRGPAGAGKTYEAAVGRYGAFVVAASALKGRDAITGQESETLEQRRSGVRSILAALTLRGRACDLRAISEELAPERARPGCGALTSAAQEAGRRFEAAADSLEAGSAQSKEQVSLVRGAEEEFAAFYIKYSVYSGLLGLKIRSEALGFSCVYDYLLWRWLAWFSPESAYVRNRAAVTAAGVALGEGLQKAGEGELAAALAGPGGRAAETNAALEAVRRASAANRAAQFFAWGILFRPVEIEVSARKGKPFFQPAFTFYSVTGPRQSR